MDDLRFYVLFNSISVISGRCLDDNESCVQWNSVYGWEDVTSSEDRTRSARSVGQRLTHWATGAPHVVQSRCHSICYWGKVRKKYPSIIIKYSSYLEYWYVVCNRQMSLQWSNASNRCSKNGKQCRSWSDCSLRAVWSESKLFAQTYMSQYLEFLWYASFLTVVSEGAPQLSRLSSGLLI